ncbi:MAG: efflux RND transporter periplasmic adaptor subunit [Burkholderiaceae bacterium]
MNSKQRMQTVLAVAVAAALVMGAISLTHHLEAANQPVVAEPEQVASPVYQNGVLQFPTNAPQLSTLRTEIAATLPLPVSEPLNGRLALDENRTARVSSPIAGRVLAVRAEVGERVARDAVLLQADAPELAAADADNQKAVADERRKKLAYDRARTLLAHEVVPQKDVEAAEADYRQAVAESRRSALRMKNLHASGADNGRFNLRSPLAGVVVERQVTPGMELRPDQAAPLFVISDPARLWLLVDVPERSLGRVQPGQKVGIETEAYPGAQFTGTVEKVGFGLDPTTRRVQVRCAVDNADGRLRPEMFARVSFLADNNRRAIVLPNGGLVTEGIHTYAFVEKAPGAFEKRQVSLALRGRDVSFIETGLATGEKVVVEGALLLSAEMASHAR